MTFELFEVFHKMMKARNRLPFFVKHYRGMQKPLLDISKRGIKVDRVKRDKRRGEFKAELEGSLKQIEFHAGKSLAGKTNLSSKKVQEYLYTDLRLPKQMRKRGPGEKTTSADEVAIRTLMLKFPERLGTVGKLMLRCQRLGKLIGFLKDTKLDEDGRLRSQYKFNTTSGRLASGGNPFGTGDNAQNQDRELRDLFIGG